VPQAIRSCIDFTEESVACGWPVGQETNRGCLLELPFSFGHVFSVEEKIAPVDLPTNEH